MQLNYKLIFNKDQLFGLSGDQPPSEKSYLQALPIVTSERKLRCDERGPVINNKRHSCLSQEIPKILDALCQEAGEKAKYCFIIPHLQNEKRKRKTQNQTKYMK